MCLRGLASELADTLEASEKLAQTLISSLARYEPTRLGLYEHAGRRFSRVLEFLGLLINAESQPVPLPLSPLNGALATTRTIFGSETIDIGCRLEPASGRCSASRNTPRPPRRRHAQQAALGAV